ncbi:LysE family transporter [Streptomyces sp. BH-SS-21]|uniref:LysE family transporter n=1 Tax=Streptomyces liliiviolaceus TaxID=2823109 RepID=A0A940XZJ8_9ACTN|nr:LysE family transporter [Streptomyces liliiviolaceus]MBQ0850552.1 LysE family transporter [Streptomyces liliiviolaceus]
MSELLGFFAASLVVIVMPGPDLTLLLANTARSGRRAAHATAAGIMLGHALLATAAVAGPTALLAASQIGYTALRITGALYLIYLGAQPGRLHPPAPRRHRTLRRPRSPSPTMRLRAPARAPPSSRG